MNKELLLQYVEEGLTIRQISEKINLSYTGIRYWIKKFEIKTLGSKRFKKWNKEDLGKFILESKTKSDVLRKLGVLIRPGNFRTLDRYISIYNLDISHFNSKLHDNRFNNIIGFYYLNIVNRKT